MIRRSIDLTCGLAQGAIAAYDPHVSDGNLLCICNQLSFFSPSVGIIGSELGTDQKGLIWRCQCVAARDIQSALCHHMRSSSMHNPLPKRTILVDGKLKPGLYKIQNLVSKTYVDIHEHTMKVCCRPASALEKDIGIVRTLRFPTVSHGKPILYGGKCSRSAVVIRFVW